MKVLLVNAMMADALPPPSIGYLQSSLKRYGIDVIARNINEALNMPDEFDIVGVTFHSFSVKFARQIRDKFKCHLVCGGHHPSSLLLVRKPSDEKLMIDEIQPFINEYITENNVPEMGFFKTVHYDKV